MKIISLLLVTLFIIGGSIPADAQLGNLKRKLETKLERKIDQVLDRKIDQAIEESFEKGTEREPQNTENQSEQKEKEFDLNRLGIGTTQLTDVYEFDIQIDWLVTTEDRGEPMEMSQMMSRKQTNFGMQVKDKKGKASQGVLIVDLSKDYLIIIPEDVDQAMITSLGGNEAITDETNESEASEGSFTATGQSKQILGYHCQQYIFETNEAEGEMWLTTELDLPNFDLFSYLQKMAPRRAKQNYHPWETMKDGFVLEMTSKDAKGRVSKIETKRIDEQANIKYDMKKYSIMDMTKMDRIMRN